MPSRKRRRGATAGIPTTITIEMILRAKQRLKQQGNVLLIETDIMDMSLPPSSFDLIVSIAAFHHLPLKAALKRCVNWLAPRGALMVLDLCTHGSTHPGIGFACWLSAALL